MQYIIFIICLFILYFLLLIIYSDSFIIYVLDKVTFLKLTKTNNGVSLEPTFLGYTIAVFLAILFYSLIYILLDYVSNKKSSFKNNEIITNNENVNDENDIMNYNNNSNIINDSNITNENIIDNNNNLNYFKHNNILERNKNTVMYEWDKDL